MTSESLAMRKRDFETCHRKLPFVLGVSDPPFYFRESPDSGLAL